ncbi:hypothetical protein LOK49_LG05G02214 [Camellia lanceoleosa]|uniref:Uncharacterized protein n=1 Tax=Camellia lanceoleosa TaxID=1840588 RepID=A0ACC0HNM8_9ERIC|nr:hypothetical protein LOK49_LG05G02214 [Camellia lanceoleosa]
MSQKASEEGDACVASSKMNDDVGHQKVEGDVFRHGFLRSISGSEGSRPGIQLAVDLTSAHLTEGPIESRPGINLLGVQPRTHVSAGPVKFGHLPIPSTGLGHKEISNTHASNVSETQIQRLVNPTPTRKQAPKGKGTATTGSDGWLQVQPCECAAGCLNWLCVAGLLVVCNLLKSFADGSEAQIVKCLVVESNWTRIRDLQKTSKGMLRSAIGCTTLLSIGNSILLRCLKQMCCWRSAQYWSAQLKVWSETLYGIPAVGVNNPNLSFRLQLVFKPSPSSQRVHCVPYSQLYFCTRMA